MSPTYRIACCVIIATTAAFMLTAAAPVSAQTISYVSLPAQVGTSLQSSAITARLSSGQHGGITVSIESADTTRLLITSDPGAAGGQQANVFVPNGSTDAVFYVQALESVMGTVGVTAIGPGFAAAIDSIAVVQPSLDISGLNSTADPFSPLDDFVVVVGIANGANTAISTVQKARAGGPSLLATVSHTNPAAAQLVTTSTAAQIINVLISAGQSQSPGTVASGGATFDALAAGTSNVSASIPGFLTVDNVPKTVTVSASQVSFIDGAYRIGSGLQKPNVSARLSASNHGGSTINIAVSDPTKILVAEGPLDAGSASINVFVPDGQTDAVFYVQALDGITGLFTMTASAAGFLSDVEAVQVVTPAYRISGLVPNIDTIDPNDPFTVEVGLPDSTITTLTEVQATRAGGPGIVVSLVSSNSGVGLLETLSTTDDTVTVNIAPGTSSTPATVGTGGVAFSGIGVGSTTVTAIISGILPTAAASRNVSVTQAGFTYSPFASIVAAGHQSVENVARLGAPLHGGVTVHVETSDSTVALVSVGETTPGSSSIDVFVPDGQTDVSFYIHAIEGAADTITVDASAPGFADGIGTLAVVAPSIVIQPGSLSGTLDTLDPSDLFVLVAGHANGSGTNVTGQQVRAGAPNLIIGVTSDDATAAQLKDSTTQSDTVTLSIAAGSSQTGASLGSGGIALNGLSPGVTTVNVTIPGYLPIAASSQTVTITGPTMTISNVVDVGAGLQSGVAWVTLSANEHGGVPVRIESADSTTLLVSNTVTSPGQPFVDVFVPNGTAIASFYMHGVEDKAGTVRLTVSAPQFASKIDSANIVQPAVEIVFLGSSIDVSDPPDEFQTRVGLPNAANSAVLRAQERRAGQPPLVVTVISSNGAVAELMTLATTDDTVTVDINPGQKASLANIASGGVGLVSLAAGQTIVTASIPGFIQTGAAQRTVNVTNLSVAFTGLPQRIGAGLQSSAVFATLGEADHGGVTMHIEISDAGLALLSDDPLIQGGASLDIAIANGATQAIFYLQALDASLGDVTVTASAPGFADGAKSVDIVPPALTVSLLADTIAAFEPDDNFIVQIGAVNMDSTGIFAVQSIRGGGASRTVTVTTTNSLIGALTSTSTSGDIATLTIAAGEQQTPSTVPFGGVAFDPQIPGDVVVSASIPDFVATDGATHTVTVTPTPIGIPDIPGTTFELRQNAPNPFNPSTKIRFSLPVGGRVVLTVYDVTGARVTTLVNGDMPAGWSEVEWRGVDHNSRSVGSGVYFYKLVAGSYVETRKMLLLK